LETAVCRPSQVSMVSDSVCTEDGSGCTLAGVALLLKVS